MELRKKTQVGMMECKKALAEANGDMELAEEILLKSGAAKAEKKSDRVANEGLLFVSQANDNSAVAVVEINCETDFVARSDDFQSFGNKLAELALKHNSQNIDSLLESAKIKRNHILKCSIFLKNMSDFEAVNKLYADYFEPPFPARETVEVARLPKDVNIEISFIASLD